MNDYNPELDLVFERTAPYAPELFWEAWTSPEHLKQWFCPKPWFVSECEIDLRAGGLFKTVFNGPDGERFENVGSYLEIVPCQKLVWTNLLGPDFRPQPLLENRNAPDFPFTVSLTLDKTEEGCHYLAHVKHASAQSQKQHQEMGFEAGWGAAFDQLIEILKASPKLI